MGYINVNKVLEYLDHRLKTGNLDSGSREEIKMVVSMVITTPMEKVRRDDESIVRKSTINGKTVLHYCSSCRKLVKEGDIFCSKCGRRLLWQQAD